MAVKRISDAVKDDDNTGLSARAQRNQRSIREDGTFNVKNIGMPFFRPEDFYLQLITMPWLKFSFIVLGFYMVVNTFFAVIYYLIGLQHLTNIEGISEWERFLDGFYFSAQSLTTVGYGRVAPVGLATSSVAAFESLIGLMGFALVTGLLYGRFSKPNAKIIHSKNALIAPYKGGTALMFRIANRRETQLVEVEVQVTMAKIVSEDGREIRRFYPLSLEREKITMFPMAWTIVHPIDESSLLFGESLSDIKFDDTEFLVYIKGYDETFSQTVHARISYRSDDIIWGAKFVINYDLRPDGPTLHYLDKVSEYELVDLPAVTIVGNQAPSGIMQR